MTETKAQQRTRILAAVECDPKDYDLALALGYEPESWDGMWKLPANKPFRIIGPFIIVTECVNDATGKVGVKNRKGTYKMRRHVRLLPR